MKNRNSHFKSKLTSLCLTYCLALPMVVIGLTGCAGDRYHRSTGEYIDDKTLDGRVKHALGDNPEYKFDDVKVAAFKGTVQLNGFVNSSDQKKKAGQIAEKVDGVKSVENKISVKP